jgi:hypothetical protein
MTARPDPIDPSPHTETETTPSNADTEPEECKIRLSRFIERFDIVIAKYPPGHAENLERTEISGIGEHQKIVEMSRASHGKRDQL